MVNHPSQFGTASDQPSQPLWSLLAAIPPGRVTTYGRLAALAGRPGAARWVGRQLAALPSDSSLPWHRVVNSRGAIAARPGAKQQIERLRAERVVVSAERLSLNDYLWLPE